MFLDLLDYNNLTNLSLKLNCVYLEFNQPVDVITKSSSFHGLSYELHVDTPVYLT